MRLALQPRPLRTQRHVLYRHFDGGGKLLYIGISCRLRERMAGHGVTASWFNQIKTITLEHYPDRGSFLLAEHNAIKAEKPLHNRDFKLRAYHETIAEAMAKENAELDIKIAAIINRT